MCGVKNLIKYSEEMIHTNDARKILLSKEEVDIKYWKADGSIMMARNVVCISSYHKNNTLNIKFMTSGEIRTIRMFCIFEINKKEIHL